MKIPPNELHHKVSTQSLRTSGCIAIFTLTLLLTAQAFGQAPALLWSTNVGATLFAVDENTNAYANVGGTVIKINAAGVPLQTNAICPLPGVAQRDAAGNFYFAGDLDGTQNFGGITVMGGFIHVFSQHQIYEPGYPTPYVAKYDAAGALQWVNSFGPQYISYTIRSLDMLVDSTGSVYEVHKFDSATLVFTRLTNTGTNQWNQNFNLSGSAPFFKSVKFGGLTPSNCVFLTYTTLRLLPNRISSSGTITNVVPAWGLAGTTIDMTNAKPVIDNLGRVIMAGRCDGSEAGCSGQRYLRKYALDGSIAWSVATSAEEQWVLARDNGENIYLAGTSGLLARYDTNGELLWTNNYSKKIINMLVDASDNRFVGFADGSIARIAPENPPQPPQILTDPQGQTLFTGSNITFTASVSGSLPLRYFWQLNGVNIPNATNAVLNLSNLQASQSGNYSLHVTNAGGSITSAPALLTVKRVGIFLGGQFLTTGTYILNSPPVLSIGSAFAGGSVFYTRDGSTPSFASTFYSGPFNLSQTATVRAVGYNATFTQSEEADAVNIVIVTLNTLNSSSSGGGLVALSTQTNSPSLPAGMVGLWAGNGSTYDSIGSNHGTAEGGLTYGTGQVSQAFAFNGTDARVGLPENSTLDLGANSGLTIACWFKPTSVSTPYSLVEWYDSAWQFARYYGVQFWVSAPAPSGGGPGSLYANLVDASAGGNFHVIKSPSGLFDAGQFHHAALSYDKGSGLTALYLDGILVAQTNLGSFTPETRTSYFKPYIGGIPSQFGDPNPGRPAQYFSGLMDEVCFFNRALSATEVQNLYLVGSPPTNPPSGSFPSTNLVTATAIPSAGWSFLYWLGDASGTNPVATISMERSKVIHAVFGTTLSTTVAGSGQVQLSPPGGLYPYGAIVRLTGVPDPGNYFGFWGNAATGNTNPLDFVITAPAQTVSSIFGPTQGGQAALTVLVNGHGRVNASPRSNSYALNQAVVLTAIPDSGQTFLSWSGAANGSQNPLSVTMTTAKVVTANFSARPVLRVDRRGIEGLVPEGFRMTLLSDPLSVYQVLGSTNLSSWDYVTTATNIFGELQIIDPAATNLSKRFYQASP